jgi:hypothetical protein
MTGLVRKATLLSVCGLLVAGSAMAFVPSPITSSVPCAITVVGNNAAGTTADPSGDFTVTVKDIAGNPINNSTVVVDFSGCCNDIRLTLTQLGAGVSLNAPLKQVSAQTNALGQVTIRVEGATTNNATTPGLVGCAKIFADGQLLSDGVNHPFVGVGVFDLDGAAGAPGVGIGDISAWVGDFFAASYRQRANYSQPTLCAGTPSLAIGMLSQLVGVFFTNNSFKNGAGTFAACP